MKKRLLLPILLFLASTFGVQAQISGDLVISEISYNPPEGGADTTEFIEFVNVSTATIQLNNYSFTQGVTHTFGINDSITPGQYFVIAVDSASFNNRFGIDADAVWTSGGLSNSGEDIVIVDDLGNTVDSVDYDDNSPWPIGPPDPDGSGPTIILCDLSSDNNVASNWTISAFTIAGAIVNGNQAFASPGVADSACLISPITAVTVVDSNVTCNGFADGGATASVTGGTIPYTYSWSNGATTASITGLAAGQYIVTINDASSTSVIDSIIITEPSVLASTITTTNTTTSSSTDGTANVTTIGGTPAYTYLWSNAATNANITSLAAGTYTVTIIDANGCTLTDMTTIQGPAAVLTSISGQNVSCNGGSDGNAIVTATGGMTPYTFAWNGGPVGQGTDSISGLVAGQYFVTVTDAVGVTAIDSVMIIEPAPIVTSLSATNVTTIGGSDGAITSTVSGGTSPYTFLWSTGSAIANITNLSAGTYTLSITDANGCLSINSAIVNEPGILADFIITEINYNGPESGTDTSEFIEFYNNGSTTVLLDGYTFGQGVTHTFGTNDSIVSGQYFVIAFDSSAFRNRFGIDADAIWTSGGLSNSGEDITIVDDFGRTVDSVDFDDSSPWPAGTASPGPDGGGSSIELINLMSDNNDGANWIASTLIVPGVVVNGLQVFGSAGNPFTVGVGEIEQEQRNVKVYPNPTAGNLIIELSSLKEQEILQVYDMTGKLVFDEKLTNTRKQIDLDELVDGIYLMRIGTITQKIMLNK